MNMGTQLIRRENGIDYVLLTRDRLEDALSVQASTMANENIAIGLGMFEESGAPEEMQLIFREVVKDGVSIIAIDVDTNEIAGVIFNKMHASIFSFLFSPSFFFFYSFFSSLLLRRLWSLQWFHFDGTSIFFFFFFYKTSLNLFIEEKRGKRNLMSLNKNRRLEILRSKVIIIF